MSLNDYSSQDLQHELDRRNNRGNKAPQPLAIPKTEKLKEILSEYINGIYSGKNYETIDIKHSIFVIALKSFYGDDIFDWIRKNEC